MPVIYDDQVSIGSSLKCDDAPRDQVNGRPMIFLETHESTIRLSVFAGIFMLMAVLEVLSPRKQTVLKRSDRWLTNWSLVVINTLALRFLMPVLAVGMAGIATKNGWGLLSVVTLPVWIEIVLAVIILDFAVYVQHLAVHKIPIFWRVHKVHHVDRDIDVTTGARFHPIEILLSMAYKLAVVIVLGPAAMAVFIFDVVLNASSMFNHSNVKLPLGLDRAMRQVIVTPDMHRVHHSIIQRETNSNYGFCLSLWDRLFSTYIPQPDKGHDGMTIGLEGHLDEKPASLLWCLIFPFLPSRPSSATVSESEEV